MLNLNSNKIDEVFKGGLNDLSSAPSDAVWAGIESHLSATAKKKRIIFYHQVGIAASIVTLLGLFIVFDLLSPLENNQALLTAGDVLNSESTSNGIDKEIKLSKKVIVEGKKSDPIALVSAVSTNSEPTKTVINSIVDTQENEEEEIVKREQWVGMDSKDDVQLPISIISTKFLHKHSRFKEFEEVMFASNNTSSKRKQLRVHLGGSVSSAYNSKQSGSANQSVMYSHGSSRNTESGIITLGGGINVRIEGQSRWSFETGVLFAQLGQEVSQTAGLYSDYPMYGHSDMSSVMPTPADLSNSMGAISLNEGSSIEFANDLKNEGMNIITTNSMLAQSDALRQTLDYLEVPLMARYQVLESFVNLSLSGGVSTNFLIGNNAYMISDGKKIEIGETADIKPMALSSSVGIGMELPLSKIVRFNIEPRFKYYMGSVSSNDAYSFQPYSFAFFGGITVLIK
ncbi:outer membrane beta-barrel protein [Carboxylicivirga sp. N1Y90]|uniref:outer membrane beta-barrel protein n=1 Tax=Carboxylicivirga fragile TaxID=3417571 RepID=UPI003D354467|nr:outer membrane beta-barrel protein [Marinilabiliaceae bacterium N1Y90]